MEPHPEEVEEEEVWRWIVMVPLHCTAQGPQGHVQISSLGTVSVQRDNGGGEEEEGREWGWGGGR